VKIPISPTPIPHLGAQDPELPNSPIVDEWERDEEEPPLSESAQAVCYFNGAAFAVGALVRSGPELLRCAEGGVWVKVGEEPPPA